MDRIESAADFLRGMLPEVAWGDVESGSQAGVGCSVAPQLQTPEAHNAAGPEATRRGGPGSATRLRRTKRSQLLSKISGLRKLNLPQSSASNSS